MYEFYNANRRGRHVNDCTVRAISLAEDITWDEAYYKLSNLARKEGLMMDSVEFIEKYLDDRYDRTCYRSTSVGEFMDEYDEGVFLVTMPGHITVIIDGVLYDTFDCSDRIMRCAWEVTI